MLQSDDEPTDVGLELVLIRKITSEIKLIRIRHVQGLNRGASSKTTRTSNVAIVTDSEVQLLMYLTAP